MQRISAWVSCIQMESWAQALALPRHADCLQDGDFSEQRFRDIVNAFLANSVGNLLNRTLGLLRKNCAGTLPASAAAVPADNPLRAVAELEVRPQEWLHYWDSMYLSNSKGGTHSFGEISAFFTATGSQLSLVSLDILLP